MTGSQNPSAVVREIVTPCLILNLAKDSHRAIASQLTIEFTHLWMFLCPILLYILLAREFACDDKLDDRDAFLSGEIIKIRKEIGEGKIQ